MKLNIGDNIYSYRRKVGMTQKQFADKLGVSYQSVSRWENGSTYPDMELLSPISRIFNISVDELLGIPDEKKEQAAADAFRKLEQASFEDPVDTEKVNECIRDIRRNHLDSPNLCYFWLSTKHSVYRLPEVLPEVRLTMEAVLESNMSNSGKNQAIEFMAKVEDDEHIDSFLSRYASDCDITKNSLLRKHFCARGEWEKADPLRQFSLFAHIDDLTGSGALWQYGIPEKPSGHYAALNRFQLNLLHQLCGQIADEKHPVSGNGELDFWVDNRIWLGFQRTANLAGMGETEEAFITLEDTVSLFEKAMEITSPIELRCTSPWLTSLVWTAEEDWVSTEVSPLTAKENERVIRIHNDEYDINYVLHPSWYRNYLTTQKGWEWLDPIRDDPRYQTYVERMNKLVVLRPKK